MFQNRTVLAVVPARSGSKGIRDKNMKQLAGHSLIAHAGRCLAEAAWVDARIISTDSAEYAAEGRRHGLAAPFLRPTGLSGDSASAADTVKHALEACEQCYGKRFDVVLIIEPTSPMRTVDDLEACVRILTETGADSIVSVSPVDSKFHPLKLLRVHGSRLAFFHPSGKNVVARQELKEGVYFKNGLCYALDRDCVAVKRAIITENSAAYIVERPVVNIDTELDLAWAEFLMNRQPGSSERSR